MLTLKLQMLTSIASATSTASSNLGSLFTLASLLSLQGAAAACLIVPNVLGILVGPKFGSRVRNWCAFILAMSLAYLTAALVTDGGWPRWIIAFFNGFLIFASAYGLDAAGVNRTGQGRRAQEAIMRGPASAERRFFIPWTF
jgi:hypothetical protein